MISDGHWPLMNNERLCDHTLFMRSILVLEGKSDHKVTRWIFVGLSVICSTTDLFLLSWPHVETIRGWPEKGWFDSPLQHCGLQFLGWYRLGCFDVILTLAMLSGGAALLSCWKLFVCLVQLMHHWTDLNELSPPHTPTPVGNSPEPTELVQLAQMTSKFHSVWWLSPPLSRSNRTSEKFMSPDTTCPTTIHYQPW